MIEINLLPNERKKKKAQFKKIDLASIDWRAIPLAGLVYAVFGAAMIILILLLLISMYAKTNYNALDARYKAILPDKKTYDSLKADMGRMKKKIDAIDELMVERFGWAKKLNSLSDVMMPGIWLTDISYDEKLIDKTSDAVSDEPKDKAKSKPGVTASQKSRLRYLYISGHVLNSSGEGTATVGKFIKNLKESSPFYSDFSDIQLDSIKREKIDDQEAMNFKIRCLFKEAG